MDKQQMQKILIPAAAVAGVILLVGLIIATGSSEPGGDGKKAPEPKAPPGAKTFGSGPMDASGMSATDASGLPPSAAPEWKEIGDGVKIWDVKVGEDDGVAELGDTPIMHYTGWRANDGFVFDSSVKKGEPLNMPLSDLIKGWQKGVPGMKPGGIRRLFIPSALGYGPRGSGSSIPPNTDLVFEMKLLRIVRK